MAEGNVLEEVVVTAQKRQQSIQDVGIAIDAFTGPQMTALGFNSSMDIASMSPGVHVGGSIAGQTEQLTIRGVTQNDFSDWVESPIAVYLDGGYIAMAQGQTFSMFDLKRVEIDKGPQSTLFGRNATGGVIRYITNKPTRDFEANANFTYGSYNQEKFEGAVSGPLSDTLAGRAAILYNRHDPILKNIYPYESYGTTGSPGGGQDLWNDDTLAGRAHLDFKPNDRMDFLVSLNYARTNTSSGAYQSSPAVPVYDAQGRLVNSVNSSPTNTCEAYGPGNVCVPISGVDGEIPAGAIAFGPSTPEDNRRPVPGGDFFGYIDPNGPNFTTSTDFAYKNLDKFRSWGASGTFTWDLGWGKLTSISDYKQFYKKVLMDVDAAPVPQSIFESRSKEQQFSQEVRLAGSLERVRWLAGFYYLYINNHTVNGLAFPATSPLLGLVGPNVYASFAGLDANNLVHLTTNSYSVFGQFEFDLTDKLTFIGGLRTVRELKDFSWVQNAYVNTADTKIDTGILAFPLLPLYTHHMAETLWAGKVQLNYKPTANLLLYGGINRGVKAGSFNAQLADGSPPLPADQIPYKPEVLTDYEGGFKWTLFNGTTRFNGDFFYYSYKNYQAFLFQQSSGTVTNNDDTTYGTEFQLQTSPLDGLDMMFSVAYFHATVEDLKLAPGLLKNVQPSFAPELQYAGLARYQWPALGGTMAVQGDFNWSSSFYYNLRNFDSQKYGSYIVGNFRVSYKPDKYPWSVAAFVNNVADERYGVMGFDLSTLCGCNENFYGKPRWFGVTVSYNYK